MKQVRLVYASTLVEPLNRSNVQQIMSTSWERNGSTGVTGFLCLSNRFALQCLEGPRLAVNDVYGRILRDPRHTQVTLIRYTEPWRRLFAAWSMGLSAELDSAAPNAARWRDEQGLNPYLVDSDLIENLIQELCERTERVELRA